MKIIEVDQNNQLQQILNLQKKNHYSNISIGEKKKKGFVTVLHSMDEIYEMNLVAPQIIGVDNDEVVAYALVMLRECSDLISTLIPMFSAFESVVYKGEKLNQLNYYVMGQVCVAEEYRGKGFFRELFKAHKNIYSNRYDYLITEVSTSNLPSMKAHEKVGFKIIKTFRDDTDEWNILLWDWN